MAQLLYNFSNAIIVAHTQSSNENNCRQILITQRAVQSNAKVDLIVVRSIDIRCSGEFVAEAQIFAYVTVRFDCNTSPTLHEEESSDSDAEENTITDIGYHVVEDNEKLGENSFSYVYDD